MKGEEPCPHCGERPARSWHYRLGERAGEKIIERCAGNEAARSKWGEFLSAFRECAIFASQDTADFLAGAFDKLQAGK